MDTSQTLFLMHIMDGYSFRNMIGIIKSETEYATMVLSEKKIEISFVNSSKCGVHKIVLNAQELTMYRYNIRGQDNELLPEFPIAFETNEMFGTTKGIGRRDGIRLYWLAGDNKISVQPIKTTIKDPGRVGALFVKILTLEHFRYESGVYGDEPNVKVQAKEFADLCSQANTLKCLSMELVGHKHAVTVKGIFPNQNIAFYTKHTDQTKISKESYVATNIDEVDTLISNMKISDPEPPKDLAPTGLSLNVVKSEDLMTVRIPITTVKALSKIHNISPAGTLLRFYFAENKPTKIESPIGIYGLYTICLRNYSHKA